MAGNTLFRPEDRLAWYADWLKFLQEREADLRAQLARQEKSARKAEPPPEAGIAFVSDQAQGDSFLDIAFGEQASTPQSAADDVVVGAGLGTVRDGDADEAPDGATGADVFAESQSAQAGAEAGAVVGDEEPEDTVEATATIAPAVTVSDDEPPVVEEEPVPPADENGSLSPSPSLHLPPSPTPEPPKEDLA